MSFKKLNFIRFDWTLIVFIGCCIVVNHCSPATSSNLVPSQTESPAEFDQRFHEFILDLQKSQAPASITEAEFTPLSSNIKQMFLHNYKELNNAEKAFAATIPLILDIMIQKWATAKKANWNLKDLRNEFNFDTRTYWTMISPLLIYLSEDSFADQFDVSLGLNYDIVMFKFGRANSDGKKKAKRLTEVGKLMLKLAYSYEMQLQRIASETGNNETHGTKWLEDMITKIETICRQRNIPFNVDCTFTNILWKIIGFQ